MFPILPKNLLGNTVLTNIFYILVKIALLLPIAGCSVRNNPYRGKTEQSGFKRAIAPRIADAKTNDKKPSDDQIEVALVALKMTLEKEELRNGLKSVA